MADRSYLERLTKQLSDEGKLIEAGWVAMRMNLIPLNAPANQLQDLRFAYMAGAQHLFSSIMSILDPGEEPTDDDLRRMDLIDKELREFAKELKLLVDKTSGTA